MADYRTAFDEAIVNMSISTSPYFHDYVFYMHLIAQCRVVFTETLPAPAAVTFKKDHYVLYLNPTTVLGTTTKGKPYYGFCDQMPLEHRIGILKHEMLHIALGHLIRVENRNFKGFNYASDCALNQEIDKSHLPEGVIYPHNLPAIIPASEIRLRDTAEYYYDILNFREIELLEGGIVDDHEKWKEVEGDATLQKDLTKNMVEKAANDTQKNRGNLPNSYAQMIDNLTVNREVCWKRTLRNLVGNKRVNKVKTLLRKNRRLPNANYIKGTTKDRQFELGIISDVSGSVNNAALYTLWGSVIDLCKTFSTKVNLVQVDTHPTPPTLLTHDTRALERKACGGTYLSPAIEMFKQHSIHFDALVVTTDGELSTQDVDVFYKLQKPVIWLIEPNGTVMSGMNRGHMKAIKLKTFTGTKE